jgi:hypothetical protein
MHEYSTVYRRRNGRNKSHARMRSLKWHGPRFIRGRRSTRLTAVWQLRPRRLMSSEVPA